MDGMNENRMPKLFVCIVHSDNSQDTCCQKRQKNLATSWIKIAFCSFLKMRLNWLRLELLDLFLSWQTQQEQRKLACAMPNAAIYCLSKKDDSYCCFLFITCANGMFSRRQRRLRRENVALLHYFAEKYSLQLMWFGGLAA